MNEQRSKKEVLEWMSFWEWIARLIVWCVWVVFSYLTMTHILLRKKGRVYEGKDYR